MRETTQKDPRRRQPSASQGERPQTDATLRALSEGNNPANSSTSELSSLQHRETTNFCGLSPSDCVVLCHGSPSKLTQSRDSLKSKHIYWTPTVRRVCTKRLGDYERNQQKPPSPCRAHNSLENKARMCAHNTCEKSGDERWGCLKGSTWWERNGANFMSRAVKMEVNSGLNNPKWMMKRFVISFATLFTTFACECVCFCYSWYWHYLTQNKTIIKRDNFSFIQEVLTEHLFYVKVIRGALGL